MGRLSIHCSDHECAATAGLLNRLREPLGPAPPQAHNIVADGARGRPGRATWWTAGHLLSLIPSDPHPSPSAAPSFSSFASRRSYVGPLRRRPAARPELSSAIRKLCSLRRGMTPDIEASVANLLCVLRHGRHRTPDGWMCVETVTTSRRICALVRHRSGGMDACSHRVVCFLAATAVNLARFCR